MLDIKTGENYRACAGRLQAERDEARNALELIKAKLSITDVPQDEWVRELHGELFVIAHHALTP